jgi:hypothetical protein
MTALGKYLLIYYLCTFLATPSLPHTAYTDPYGTYRDCPPSIPQTPPL